MPSELQTAKTFFLVSGILNILGFLGWGTSTVLGGIATCGAGCLIGFLPVINIVSCIMDFIAYNKLNTLNQKGTFSTIQTASVFQIITILTGNIVSFIFGIINLNNIGKEHVSSFLKEKEIY
ncbi:MAG TPA: hypothetical protein PKC91_03010 [Ignavibacteria bacterium]|nr:hypothetical protein [Ignavibacteria bacterium]